MERRVLIVEPQNEFALSMAAVLKTAGYQTAMAPTSADAQRELEKRRPDLVVLRAELPDQSGFVLCGHIKKGRFGQNLPVLLVSSDMGQEGLSQHSQGPQAADGYLSIPFEMGDLAQMTQGLVPLKVNGAVVTTNTDDEVEVDSSLDKALAANAAGLPPRVPDAPAPPPFKVPPPGLPPKLPKRERRSAITDEDRAFLDRTFQSIADRKAELLAESRQTKRTAPRREQMGTPEGKIQILRDELKVREAQVARLSEVWGVRERELLSVEDRLHEKDVEVQGLKMQVDDLLRRFNDAQALMVSKEREHGATVDDLLLQRFATEKDLIEVVASKEKDINGLRRDLSTRDEELARKSQELEAARSEGERLEKELGVLTLEGEVREQKLAEGLKARDAELEAKAGELAKKAEELQRFLAERDAREETLSRQVEALTLELDQTQHERDSATRTLTERAERAEANGQALEAELGRVVAESSAQRSSLETQLSELDARLGATETQREALRAERDTVSEELAERIAERNSKVSALEQQLQQSEERFEEKEAELSHRLAAMVERAGELEGEVESLKGELAEQEQELTQELGALKEAKRLTEEGLRGAIGAGRVHRF